MNLLDTASLVVTPNGYKASKLYSIIPSDGTGDMTFARTGDTATRVNPSGLIEVDAANIPRLDYTGGGCPKLLLEPQRTNLVIRSQEIDNANYVKQDVTVVANDAVAADGTTTADKVYPTSTGSGRQFYSTFVITNTTIYTTTLFAKAGGKNWFRMIGIDGSGNASFNLADGTVTTISAGFTATITPYANGWYRCTLTSTSSSTTGYIGATIINSSTDNSITANGTDGVYFWGFQAEAGAYATSYIPTTTASVTRNVDTYEKTSVTASIGQTEGTMFWDGTINGTIPSIVVLMSLRNSSNANQYRYFSISTSSRIQFLEYNVSTQALIQTGTNFYVLGNRYKIAAAYKANDFVLYINGVQIGTDTSGTVFAADKIATAPDNLVKLNSQILWKTRLTNQELVTLTTL